MTIYINGRSETYAVSELFANFNVRFFGELGLPNLQTWNVFASGSATVDLVSDTVFGEVKDVVKINDNVSNGLAQVEKALTALDWLNIEEFGASYGGVCRLDTDDGSGGFFSGLQADGPENPINAEHRRYAIYFKKDGDYLNIEEVRSGNNMTFDGASGRQLILFDAYFKWEAVIPPNLAAAIVYINGIESLTINFLLNTGGLGSVALIGSGSSGGVDLISYHDNFGVTIYQESPNKLLSSEIMATNKIIIIIPPGQRNYIITLPDNCPRGIGDGLDVLANNLGGSVILITQDTNTPQILFNGFHSALIDIDVNKEIKFANIVDSGNVYQAILH